ncbi:hypothetical protein [Bradyrhizobium prioriisuperbiae]|uniref:terminase small subunit-like protein n=1 Tax=Bradyrhizobium prioriisuperbiae TaxID=2854389 RepID=UPI0028E6F48C|nr:hypothetical protein [Bradyrhizobium prioritasuperba]
MSRALSYTPELADWICAELVKGRTLKEICRAPDMPRAGTVRSWARVNRDGFAAKYADARAAAPKAGYSPERANRVCEELAKGRTVTDVCQDQGMPSVRVVQTWAQTDRDGFAAQYHAVRKIGRPTVYSVELADAICRELSAGRSLTDICHDAGMPDEASVRLWAHDDRKGFGARYRQARQFGYETLADEMLDIADDSRNDFVERRKANGEVTLVADQEAITRARLRVETRRWLLGRMLPKTYGDELDVTAADEAGHSWADLLKAVDGRSRGLPNRK